MNLIGLFLGHSNTFAVLGWIVFGLLMVVAGFWLLGCLIRLSGVHPQHDTYVCDDCRKAFNTYWIRRVETQGKVLFLCTECREKPEIINHKS